MKRSLWLSAGIGLYFATFASAQQPPAAAPGQVAPWANKFFMPDKDGSREKTPDPVIVHNFGDVPHGTLCVHKFPITNIYDTPMQITEVRKSCTCLEYGPITKILQPNESTEFVVTMNSAKFIGFNSQTFYVTFGPKYISTAVIRVQATSRTDVSITPGAVAFGTVAQGIKVPGQSIQIKYSGKSRDWKITEVVAPSGPFEVKLSDPSRGGVLRGGVDYQVDVVLKAGTQAGIISDQIILKTNDSTNPIIQVAISGTVAAPLEISPNRVRIDGIAVGQSASQRVFVRASKPFRVLGVDGAGDGLTVEMPQASTPPQLVQLLTVKFEPGKPGVVGGELRIKTDLDGGAVVILPVEAEGVK
jgi:hypothetical protein